MSPAPKTTLGVIGGSGLYELAGLEGVEWIHVDTPFGPPSDEIMMGERAGVRLVFLPRHGRGHRLSPADINYRANVFALKKLGVERVISITAVGSLRYEIEPGHMVIPDQIIDRTMHRSNTFFGGGIVAHVSLADPICPHLAQVCGESSRAAGATVHQGGVYLCMEGPQFSTRAESELYRSWGAAVIGMTNAPEARLCREAEMCFVTLALASDYDCWNTEERHVTVEDILRVVSANVELSKRCLDRIVRALAAERSCSCAEALRHAIITDPARIPEKVREDLAPLIARYV